MQKSPRRVQQSNAMPTATGCHFKPSDCQSRPNAQPGCQQRAHQVCATEHPMADAVKRHRRKLGSTTNTKWTPNTLPEGNRLAAQQWLPGNRQDNPNFRWTPVGCRPQLDAENIAKCHAQESRYVAHNIAGSNITAKVYGLARCHKGGLLAEAIYKHSIQQA